MNDYVAEITIAMALFGVAIIVCVFWRLRNA